MSLLLSDCGIDIGVLHLHLDPVVLFENAPGHASADDPERDGAHVGQLNGVDAGQDADERPRGLLLHRGRLQHVVHDRDPDALHRLSEQVPVRARLGQHHRLRRDALLLHRSGPAKVRLAPGERRHPRVLLHHPHHEAVQTDATLVRPQNPHTDVQGVGQGADSARLLPRPRHRHLRQPRLLRGEDPGQSAQRLQQHPARLVVGTGHHDDRRLRRHGTKNLCRHVRRRPLRPRRSVNHCLARTCHRFQLCHVLQPHAGNKALSFSLFM